MRPMRSLFFACTLLSIAGCANREAVSTTTTTSGEYVSPKAELFLASRDPARCQHLQSVAFVENTPQLKTGEGVELQKWALCLNQPELRHTSLVITGGDESGAVDGLYEQRAAVVRDALVGRGVDVERIVIGAGNAAAGGGRYGSTDSIRLVATGRTTPSP